MKRYQFFIIVICIITITSCSQSRKKTLLDFEFGMTHDEYVKHSFKLDSAGIISYRHLCDGDKITGSIDDAVMKYKYTLPTGLYIETEIRGDIKENERLVGIYMSIKNQLSDKDKQVLYKTFENKYGKPRYPFRKSPYGFWSTAWDSGDQVIVLSLSDSLHDEFYDQSCYGGVSYEAQGSLKSMIENQNEKDKNTIEIKNNF